MFVNIEKLEKLLVANWTEFLDARELMSSASAVITNFEQTPTTVHKLTISRFELVSDGFIIWLECKSSNVPVPTEDKKIKSYTVELLLGNDGFAVFDKPIKN